MLYYALEGKRCYGWTVVNGEHHNVLQGSIREVLEYAKKHKLHAVYVPASDCCDKSR